MTVLSFSQKYPDHLWQSPSTSFNAYIRLMKKGTSVDTRHRKHLSKYQICRDCAINVTTLSQNTLAGTRENKGKDQPDRQVDY